MASGRKRAGSNQEHETDDEESEITVLTTSKKKATKYVQKFKTDYERDFPCNFADFYFQSVDLVSTDFLQ